MKSGLRCVRCSGEDGKAPETELNENSTLATCGLCGDVRQVATIDKIIPNPKNPRHISRADLIKLKRSIVDFGFVDPVIVNQFVGRENVIIGGHQRVEAAKSLGMIVVPVVYVKIHEDKESMLNIALNAISGTWEEEKLAALLKELQDKDLDLTATGLDEPFAEEIMSRYSDDEREKLIDVAPAIPKKPISKAGEIYACGENVIMCGDATNKEHVKALMTATFKDVLGNVVWTDPPYNVGYTGSSMPNRVVYDTFTNDKLSSNAFSIFLEQLFKNYYEWTVNDSAFYVCIPDKYESRSAFEKALTTAGFRIKQTIIWQKHYTFGRSDYHYSHESVLYCAKQEFNSEWYGDRTHITMLLNTQPAELDKLSKEQAVEILKSIKRDSDVQVIKKDAALDYMHPTQKPVDLVRIMIKNNSRPRHVVLDWCLGSGTTLIACESTQRICYGIEISPAYFDVCLNRFANYSGKDPVRLQDGKLWSKIKEESK